MRLLHTKELRFEEFFDQKTPKYAILSHTWGPDEVSYQEFLAIRLEEHDNLKDQRTNSRAQQKEKSLGYQKIIAFCKYAAVDKPRLVFEDRAASIQVLGPAEAFEWVWIDTCCIDKSSSAELSEAINSMMTWYGKAGTCYAFLSDVPGSKDSSREAYFKRSRWFTRGWTLQELLAPRDIVFLDRSWTVIGTRYELLEAISIRTGIPVRHISGSSPTFAAECLSWAAKRETSRQEDEAYCLFGLFGISMPLLYGEGAGAFRRLQLEIIRSTNDESIFLWDHTDSLASHVGLLAPRLRYFDLGTFDPHELGRIPGMQRPPYSITNQGLEIRVPQELAAKGEFLLPLHCLYLGDKAFSGAYAIMLSLQRSLGSWRRVIPHARSDFASRGFGSSVLSLSLYSGLFIVPVEWVWSREDLEKRKSTVIYIQL